MSDSFVTPWTVAHQVPLSMGFAQARTVKQVVICFSRRSSWGADWTCFSCIDNKILTTELPGKPFLLVASVKPKPKIDLVRIWTTEHVPSLPLSGEGFGSLLNHGNNLGSLGQFGHSGINQQSPCGVTMDIILAASNQETCFQIVLNFKRKKMNNFKITWTF